MSDPAEYVSEGMPDAIAGHGATPVVYCLNATPDPLGSVAALCGIYSGSVVRLLSDLSDADRRHAFENMLKTQLSGPLEAVQFHFLVEGVSRSFTHQAVRNRFSFFAQESLRFATVAGEDWTARCVVPPSVGMPGNIHQDWDSLNGEERRAILRHDAYQDALINAQSAYARLIELGVPAEDARSVIPHSMSTRYHWVVSLRTLLTEAGKRLCTQAQFEWRQVMLQVATAIRTYGHGDRSYWGQASDEARGITRRPGTWQFELIADALRPVCYQVGRCTFMADFDRSCRIRERVTYLSGHGIPSSEWHNPPGDPQAAINDEEWSADPNAAR